MSYQLLNLISERLQRFGGFDDFNSLYGWLRQLPLESSVDTSKVAFKKLLQENNKLFTINDRGDVELNMPVTTELQDKDGLPLNVKDGSGIITYISPIFGFIASDQLNATIYFDANHYIKSKINLLTDLPIEMHSKLCLCFNAVRMSYWAVVEYCATEFWMCENDNKDDKSETKHSSTWNRGRNAQKNPHKQGKHNTQKYTPKQGKYENKKRKDNRQNKSFRKDEEEILSCEENNVEREHNSSKQRMNNLKKLTTRSSIQNGNIYETSDLSNNEEVDLDRERTSKGHNNRRHYMQQTVQNSAQNSFHEETSDFSNHEVDLNRKQTSMNTTQNINVEEEEEISISTIFEEAKYNREHGSNRGGTASNHDKMEANNDMQNCNIEKPRIRGTNLDRMYRTNTHKVDVFKSAEKKVKSKKQQNISNQSEPTETTSDEVIAIKNLFKDLGRNKGEALPDIRSYTNLGCEVVKVRRNYAEVKNHNLVKFITVKPNELYLNGAPAMLNVTDLRNVLKVHDEIDVNYFEIIDNDGNFWQHTLAWVGSKPEVEMMTPKEFMKDFKIHVNLISPRNDTNTLTDVSMNDLSTLTNTNITRKKFLSVVPE